MTNGKSYEHVEGLRTYNNDLSTLPIADLADSMAKAVVPVAEVPEATGIVAPMAVLAVEVTQPTTVLTNNPARLRPLLQIRQLR
jgi:hypothetical protein